MISTSVSSFHPAVRIGARVISYIFHPLFVPLYVMLFLIYEVRLFPERTEWMKTQLVIQYFVIYTFLPLIAILLLKALGFVETVHLKARKDRILPFVICEIFYFWAWYVTRSLHYPDELIMFSLAIFLACSLGLIMNAYQKISMHGISTGVLCAFMILASMGADVNFGPYVTIAFLIGGATLTSRLIDSDHTTSEVYSGFFVGAGMQLVAYAVV